MKLLVSDFDGTLFQHGMISDYDQKLIMKWQEKYYFAIATGRSYSDLLSKIKPFDLYPDFIIGNNGATVDRTIISQLDKETSTYLFSSLSKYKKLLEEIKVSYVLDNEIYSKTMSTSDFFSKNLNKALIKTVLIQVSLQSISSEGSKELAEKLSNNVSYLNFLVNGKTVDIVDSGTDKAIAIGKLRKIINVRSNDVYVIGDGLNDFQMLNNYKSATFTWSPDEIKTVSDVYVDGEVGQFIEQIF